MKKSLLALAVLGAFAGTASAQSSVTVYGLLNTAVAKGNCSGATTPCAVNPGAPSGDSWQLVQYGTSRLGFRGNEDLGGGLSAQFQIEHRFAPDTGAAASATSFWNGRSYVQLSSASAGSVYLGREYTPAFWVQLKSDPFGNDGIAQTGTTITWAGFFTPDVSGLGTAAAPAWPSPGSARTSNTVGYKTPNMGGLTANVAIGLSEATGQGRNTGLNAEYAAGPIYAGFGYEKITGGASDGRSLWNIALHYDLGIVKPILYYAKAKTGAGAQDDNKVVLLAATAPLGSGQLQFGYSKITFENGAIKDNKKLGLGYDYYLSKRTTVYAQLASASGRGSSATAATTDRNTAYALGIKHSF